MVQFLQEKLESIKGTDVDSENRNFALIEWSYNKANFDKIVNLSEIIAAYTTGVNEIKQRTTDYLESVNNFMRDSGKEILFSNVGHLHFRITGKEENREIDMFSSGEIQLVVILTHLYFNPDVEEANVFVIDEPELSLHVQWQEKFVDGIMKASKETQFILATHSPSIILDKTNRCRDLTGR